MASRDDQLDSFSEDWQEVSAPSKGRVCDVSLEAHTILSVVEGYEDCPLVSLEQSVERLQKLIPNLERNVWIAREACMSSVEGLTPDESASIHLYTMENQPSSTSFYGLLNAALRSENRDNLKPYFAYLKLILTGLFKMPSIKGVFWRGVKANISQQYPRGKKIVWWGFSSCTESMELLKSEKFLGQSGVRTLFSIECENGKSIGAHSHYPLENEILLLPATQFIVQGNVDIAPDFCMVHLKEILPPHPLLKPPFTTAASELIVGSSLVDEREKRILIIGTAGVGKSSLINLLAGEPTAPVSDKAIGIALQFKSYIIEHNGVTYEFVDTDGLGESSKGQKNDGETLTRLLRFVKTNEQGFNCVVFVTRKGRIDENFEQNHFIFIQCLLKFNVPSILVITRCEMDTPLSQWKDNMDNCKAIRKYHFHEVVCGTTLRGGPMELLLVQKRKETVDNLWKAIETAALYKRKELLTDQASEDKVRGFFDRFIRGDVF